MKSDFVCCACYLRRLEMCIYSVSLACSPMPAYQTYLRTNKNVPESGILGIRIIMYSVFKYLFVRKHLPSNIFPSTWSVKVILESEFGYFRIVRPTNFNKWHCQILYKIFFVFNLSWSLVLANTLSLTIVMIVCMIRRMDLWWNIPKSFK